MKEAGNEILCLRTGASFWKCGKGWRLKVDEKRKQPRTMYWNLTMLNKRFGCGMSDNEIYKVVNSRLGWYKGAGYDTVNYLFSPRVMAMPKEDRPGLVNPL